MSFKKNLEILKRMDQLAKRKKDGLLKRSEDLKRLKEKAKLAKQLSPEKKLVILGKEQTNEEIINDKIKFYDLQDKYWSK